MSLNPMQTGGPRGRRGVKLSFSRKGGVVVRDSMAERSQGSG